MIVGIGTDIIEVERVKNIIERYGDKFLGKVFAQVEIDYCNTWGEARYQHFAARFAAKEAFGKAFGTGITAEFKFCDFAVENESGGKPVAVLSEEMKTKLVGCNVFVSLAHLEKLATAYVIIEKNV
ncbi:MAG: holo-ACP synthase [Candidatus Kapabacteria bacterium]|nr:holo-ACP synthase [Candidatus Kapabacteria bacterium]